MGNYNPQPPLRRQRARFHLERRQRKEPNLHLRKPGSCVSLLPVTRSWTRRVRKARPGCGAARLRVAFDKKHVQRCTLTLFFFFVWIFLAPRWLSLVGCPPSRSAGREIICIPKRASSSFRRHPAPYQIELPTRCGCLSVSTSNSETRPPNLSSLFVMAVPCCIFSSKGPSLSLVLSPSLSFVAEMCYQSFTSPPSL